MIVFAMALAWLPPPPPPPWHPKRSPEFTATCHATDVAGLHWSGQLNVAGQGEHRKLSLQLDAGSGNTIAHKGRSELLVLNPVADGTYSFAEYLARAANSQPFEVELKGLGAAPTTLALTIRGPARSPVFAEPAMVGLCKTTAVQAGSRFVLEPESKEPKQ